MNLSSLTPEQVASLLESPQDILASAFQTLSLIYVEKHPSSTVEELVVVMGEALMQPRGRCWIMRMGTRPSREERDELTKRLAVLQKQSEELNPYWGSGQRLPERLQLFGELFAMDLWELTSPWRIRVRTKLLEQREKKRTRDAQAGRQRNNKKAAERLVELFRKEKQWHQSHDRTSQQAETEALNFTIRHLFSESQVQDKQAVLTLFKAALQKHRHL